MIESLGDADCAVRLAAAEALRYLGDANAVEPLIQALADEANDVQVAAARALGELGDARAVKPLTQALAHASPDVHTAAVTALAKLRETSSVEPLILALFEKEELGDDPKWMHSDAVARCVPGIIQRLPQFPDEDTPGGRAVWLLGLIGDRRAIAPLAFLWFSTLVEYRNTIEQSLAQIDPEWRQSPELADLVPEVISRLFGGKPIEGIHDFTSMDDLVNFLDTISPDWRGRSEAFEAGSVLIRKLETAIAVDKSPSRDVANMLAFLKDGRSARPLIQAISKFGFEPRVVARLVSALGDVGDADALPCLSEQLDRCHGAHDVSEPDWHLTVKAIECILERLSASGHGELVRDWVTRLQSKKIGDGVCDRQLEELTQLVV